jgi:predicted nicotinamide N-methyase
MGSWGYFGVAFQGFFKNNFIMVERPSIPCMPSQEFLETFCPFSPVPGCPEIQARRSDAVFTLWERWEAEAGRECPIPFWAVVWPGARVLARFLLDRPDLIKGRDVMEIGCGGAAASIAAGMGGALRVTANDIDPIALAIARENAEQNRIILELDRENRVVTGSIGRAEIVLFSDLFYERTGSAALARLLKNWRDRSVTILIADGGRPFAPADYREVLLEQSVDVDPDLEGRERRAVRILRY